MHRVLERYAKQWRFDVNHGKTKISPIEVVDEYKYLGAETGRTRGKWNSLLKRLWDKAKACANLTMWRGGRVVVRMAYGREHLWSCGQGAAYFGVWL